MGCDGVFGLVGHKPPVLVAIGDCYLCDDGLVVSVCGLGQGWWLGNRCNSVFVCISGERECTCQCMCVIMNVCMYMYMCVCVCVCMCVCVCVCARMHVLLTIHTPHSPATWEYM